MFIIFESIDGWLGWIFGLPGGNNRNGSSSAG
jgi:hypothetical protein